MTERILNKLDEYLSKNDYTSAEKHLLFWLSEAENNNDNKIVLLVCNELMGLYRKLGKRDDALIFAERALNQTVVMNIEKNIGAATTYINTATVYKAFGMAEKSIPLFHKAKAIYEKTLSPTDGRLGGLYNNMGLAFVDLKRFEEAKDCYKKALKVMQSIADGEPEQAITYLNMASAAEAEYGLENATEYISEYLEKAMTLLDGSQNKTSGNYAFVCEKCASVFGYYGYFYYESELKERSRRIYERT